MVASTREKADTAYLKIDVKVVAFKNGYRILLYNCAYLYICRIVNFLLLDRRVFNAMNHTPSRSTYFRLVADKK